MYRFNDGIVYIYKRLPAKSDGNMPVVRIDETSEKRFYFDEIVMGVKEYYESKYSDVEVERRVQILQCRAISSQDIAAIDDKRYSVGRVKHTLNKYGIPVTELTLERLEAKYDG